MSLDWGGFFTGLGRGAEGVGEAIWKSKEAADEQKRQERLMAMEQQRIDLERQRVWDEGVNAQRTSGLHLAEHRADQLGKAGVVVPDTFYKSSMGADLPETGGQDVGGMAINALRNAGQARLGETYASVPDALNKQWKSKSMANPLPGGGFTYTPPDVRASLENAAATRQSTAAYRALTTQMTQQRLKDQEEKTKAANDANESEGLTLLNSILAPEGGKASNPELAHVFSPAFRAARASNPTMGPGALSKQVVEGLKQTHANLFPRAVNEPEDPLAKLQRMQAEARQRADSVEKAGTQPTQPTRPSGPMDQAAAAQRWDELIAQGVDPDEASQRVMAEFPGVTLQ